MPPPTIVVKKAVVARQNAGRNVFVTEGICGQLDMLPWSKFGAVRGDKAYIAFYILEALVCFASLPHATLETGSTFVNRIAKLHISLAYVVQALQLLNRKGVLEGLKGKSLTEVITTLSKLPGSIKEQLRLSPGDFEETNRPLSALLDSAGRADETYDFALQMPFISKADLVSSANLILMMGERWLYSTRSNTNGGGFYHMAQALYTQTYNYNPILTTSGLCAMGVAGYLKAVELPEGLRIYFLDFDEQLMELSRRDRYSWSDDNGREQIWSSAFDTIKFHYDIVAQLAALLTGDVFGQLKSLAMHYFPSETVRSASFWLQALEERLSTLEEVIEYHRASGTSASKILLELKKAKAKAFVSSGEADEADGSERAEKGKGFTTKALVLSIDALNGVFASSSFLKAQAKVTGWMAEAGAAKEPKEHLRNTKIFGVLGQKGLLLIWQRLLMHEALRSKHDFLNLISPLVAAHRIHVSFCHVVGAKKSRKGFSERYAWAEEQYQMFRSGNHEQVGWYLHGYLPSLQAILGADSIEDGAQATDWLFDGDHFHGLRDFMRRTYIAFGYAFAPSPEYSVDDIFDLLGRFRELILEAPVSEREPLYTELAGYGSRAFGVESSAHYLAQLAEVQPVGRRLGGVLPESSGASGVIQEIKLRLKSQSRVDKWRKRMPSQFEGQRVVGRVAGAMTLTGSPVGSPAKRPLVSDDSSSKGDEGKPEATPKGEKPPAIGSKKKKISWVANSNKNYFGLAKTIYGPLDALAAECKVAVDDRCWPVMLSYKPETDRCTVCPCPESSRHKGRTTNAHKPVQLPKNWLTKFAHKRQDFVLPTALAEGAHVGEASLVTT